MDRIEAVGAKRRKDSVVMQDCFVGGTPDWLKGKTVEEQRKYFDYAYRFFEDSFGKENIISAVVHLDEATPHMHLCFVPITKKGRLSSKEIIGGPKGLVNWQDKFYAYMHEKYPDITRGTPARLTHRKHIPPFMFKVAGELYDHYGEICGAINDIGMLNNAKKKDAAIALIAALVQDETPPADEPQETEPPQPEQTAFEKYAAVYEQNSDFVGWISIEGTNIDYPVMQTVDNPNYYLKRSFEKQYSDYGVPYVQENCDLGLSDNCVIYGHHMNNGSMFADLCKYADEDFYREHKTIRFDTLSGFGEYEVVAAFKTVAYSEQGFKYYHFVNAEDENAFNEYISQCKELALYDTGVTAEYGDRLITLSTCEYSRQNGRMVVVAKKIVSPSLEVGENEA